MDIYKSNRNLPINKTKEELEALAKPTIIKIDQAHIKQQGVYVNPVHTNIPFCSTMNKAYTKLLTTYSETAASIINSSEKMCAMLEKTFKALNNDEITLDNARGTVTSIMTQNINERIKASTDERKKQALISSRNDITKRVNDIFASPNAKSASIATLCNQFTSIVTNKSGKKIMRLNQLAEEKLAKLEAEYNKDDGIITETKAPPQTQDLGEPEQPITLSHTRRNGSRVSLTLRPAGVLKRANPSTPPNTSNKVPTSRTNISPERTF
ncbi:MAG: hypothetical protein PHD60_07400 [Clostridia bacterium]|nr:hypothetical protein [Clostridia bacterium]